MIVKHRKNTGNKNIKGNILLILLIAVALFAAVTAAVFDLGRGQRGIEAERSQVFASELVQYFVVMRQSITYIRATSNCSDIQISFERAPFDGSDTDYVNSNAPSDFRCHVFHPDGGAISSLDVDNDFLNSALSSSDHYEEMVFAASILGGDPYTGSADHDLVVFIPYVEDVFCSAFNELLGNHPLFSAAGAVAADPPYFSGSFSGGQDVSSATYDADLNGGCIAGDAPFDAGENLIYYPILVR